MRKLITYTPISLAISIVMMSVVGACNKGFDNKLDQFDAYDDTSSLSTQPKKILYLIIDGANGQIVKDLKLTNINKLASTGTYTWNALSGIETQDSALAPSWANMMTGVNSSLTAVYTGFDTSRLSEYPSFVTKLKDIYGTDLKVSAASTSSVFDQQFLTKADDHSVFSTDDQTAGRLAAQVREDNDVIIGEFHGAYDAGLKSGFDETSTDYVNALQNIDSYIGTIVNNLKGRSTYSKERWMIIVTSSSNLTKNKTSNSDPSFYNDNQMNTFAIISNSRFNETFIDKPADTRGTVAYQTSALRFRGAIGEGDDDGNRVSIPDTKNLYNCPPGHSITIETKIKINPNSSGGFSYSYPPFLSKVSSRYANNSGWSFFKSGNNILFFVGTGATKLELTGGVAITDNLWHTVSGKIKWEGNNLLAYEYIDGVLAASGQTTISNPTNTMVNNNSPLVLGYWPSVFTTQYIDLYMKDVRIWNSGLSDANIATFSCLPSELLSQQAIDLGLIGDFRINKDDYPVLKDYSTSGQDGSFQTGKNGKLEWADFNEISNAICPAATDAFYNASIKGVDLPYEIYTWLGVRIQSSWMMSGKFWQPSLNTDEQY